MLPIILSLLFSFCFAITYSLLLIDYQYVIQNVKHVFFFMPFFHFFYSYNHDSISLMKMQISKIHIFTFILIVFFASGSVYSVNAESRTGNLDLFVLIDRSLSMVEEFSAVQSYVNGQVLEDLLQ